MKSNWLVVLLIIVAGSTINLGSTLRYGNPSIEFIQNKEFGGKNGDVFIYSIKLRSNEKLLNFSVEPSIKGLNNDSDFDFLFDENIHQAVVNYFYVLPEGVDSEEVVLTFTLTDTKESNVKTKVIKVSENFTHFAKSNSKSKEIQTLSERVEIQEQNDTPYVRFDAEEGYCVLKGKSLPPDVSQFYDPLVDWLEDLKKIEIKDLSFNFKLDYYNTASSKMILEVLYKLEEAYQGGTNVIVNWYYPDDDDDMLDAGEEFEGLVDLPFNHIGYEKEY